MDNNNFTPGDVFADATIDFAFKRIFGTERYKQCTINILNRILTDHKIVDVSFDNTELLPQVKDARKSVIDVLCTDDKGSKIIVEMQRAKMEHFRERVYFYASKVIAAKEVKGIWNYGLEPTYSVSFLNFNTPPTWMGCNSVMHYVTRGEEGDKMPGSTEFFLFDLNNFEKESRNMNKYLKKWLSLLRDAKFWKEIPPEYQGDEEFAPFFEASRRAAFTAEENQKYVEDMMNEWDIETSKREAVEEARAEGMAKGEAKGRAEGMAKGKAEGKAETVVNGYRAGITIELLSQATGYSIDQINEILADNAQK